MNCVLWIEYESECEEFIDFRRFEKETLYDALVILRSWLYNCDGLRDAWAFADTQNGKRVYLDYYDLTEILQRMQEEDD